jgi:hypothetical protein
MKPTLPTKPIERAYVSCAGDPSVGIPSSSFEVELYWDAICYGDPEKALAELRGAIRSLYEDHITGEPCAVEFDYEMEARASAEQELHSG